MRQVPDTLELCLRLHVPLAMQARRLHHRARRLEHRVPTGLAQSRPRFAFEGVVRVLIGKQAAGSVVHLAAELCQPFGDEGGVTLTYGGGEGGKLIGQRVGFR